ncbi:MAG TPA: GNAT family N-acetyltransferase [Bryobacteraceae bacterium]
MPVQTAHQVAVRRLEAEDQPRLAQMYATFEPLGGALGLPSPDPVRRQEWLSTLLDSLNLVAFVDDKLVGHLALLAIDNDSAELMCFVHQNFRRQHVATILVRDALKHAKEAGFQRISVFINTHNLGARHGLLKFGFEPVWEDLEEAEYAYWLWGREI